MSEFFVSCSKCLFFKKSKSFTTKDKYYCCRYPPTALVLTGDIIISSYPEVYPGSITCGEFKSCS